MATTAVEIRRKNKTRKKFDLMFVGFLVVLVFCVFGGGGGWGGLFVVVLFFCFDVCVGVLWGGGVKGFGGLFIVVNVFLFVCCWLLCGWCGIVLWARGGGGGGEKGREIKRARSTGRGRFLEY